MSGQIGGLDWAGSKLQQIGQDERATLPGADTHLIARRELASYRYWQCDCGVVGTCRVSDSKPEIHAQYNRGHLITVETRAVEVIHS